MRYILNRLGFFILSLWAAITINFILPRMMPGSPADAMFAKFQGQLTPAALDAMKKAYGIGQSTLWQQYVDYLHGLLTFNWGLSFMQYPTPVSDMIRGSLP